MPADEVCGTVDAGVHARGSPWTRYNWIPTGASNSINRTPDGRVDFHHPKSEINESPQTKPAEPSTWESMGEKRWTPDANGSADSGFASICGHSLQTNSRQNRGRARLQPVGVDRQRVPADEVCPWLERSPLRRLPLVLAGLSESTPDANGSADFGFASICGHSLQTDSDEVGSMPTDYRQTQRRGR